MEDNIMKLANQGANVMREWGSHDDLDSVHKLLHFKLIGPV
jgi:hypothetical protein